MEENKKEYLTTQEAARKYGIRKLEYVLSDLETRGLKETWAFIEFKELYNYLIDSKIIHI